MDKKKISHIKWNLINSALAGGLVFLGSIADGKITMQGIGTAIITGMIVAFVKFKEFWDGEKPTSLFQFVN